MIDEYLRSLRPRLPRVGRGRIVAEVEDHLREAADAVGEEEAVRRFGPPDEVARQFRRASAARVAAVATLALLLSYPALYPIAENALPPAPWAAGEQPSHLAWKQDAIDALLLFAVGAAAVGATRFRRANGTLVVATLLALTASGVAAILGVVLSFQWADAVPGTPGWLPYVGFVQVGLTVVADVLLTRAALLARR